MPLLAGAILLVLSLLPDFWEAAGGWVSLSSDGKQAAGIVSLSALVLGVSYCLFLRGSAPLAGVCMLAGMTVPVSSNLLSLLAHLDVTGERTVYQVGAGYYLAVVGFALILLGATMAILTGRRRLRLDPSATPGRGLAVVVCCALAASLLISWGPIKLVGGGFNLLVLVVIGLVPLVWLSPPHSSAAGAAGAAGVVRAKLTAMLLLFAVAAGVFIAGATPYGMEVGAGVQIESASAAVYVIGTAIVLLLTVQLRTPAAGVAVALGFVLASGALNLGGILDTNRSSGPRGLFASMLILGALGALVAWFMHQGAGWSSVSSTESTPSR